VKSSCATELDVGQQRRQQSIEKRSTKTATAGNSCGAAILEARVEAQRVQLRIHLELNHHGGPGIKGFFQPLERLFRIADGGAQLHWILRGRSNPNSAG
jgi:hypothetical protein